MEPNAHAATTQELAQLHQDGFFIRHGFFSPGELDQVEQVADRAVAYYNRRARAAQDMYSIASRTDGIIFVNEFMDESGEGDALRGFSLRSRIAEFARSVAGPRAAHHCYQAVYKYPQFHDPFPWHQDHIHTPAEALSSMNEQNGCLRVIPKVALDSVLDYHDTPFGKSCWPFDHHNQGIPMVMERGSIFVITSHTLHSSGGNYTGDFRKALLAVFIDREASVYGQPVRTIPYPQPGRGAAAKGDHNGRVS
jgi:hypothetical protein